MGKKRKPDDGSGAAGLALLLILWLIIKLFWWIVAALTAVAVIYLAKAIIEAVRRRREIRDREWAAIAARADQQHNWAMQGDDRGVFGVEGAALMRTVRSDGPKL